MAIRPRVKPTAPPPDENIVAAIIGRGAGVAGRETPEPPPTILAMPGAGVAIATPPPVETAPVVVALPVEPPPPAIAKAEEPPTDAEKKFTLRLPASLLSAIEKDAKDRPDRISVNTWLIGAALQRLRQSNHNIPSGME